MEGYSFKDLSIKDYQSAHKFAVTLVHDHMSYERIAVQHAAEQILTAVLVNTLYDVRKKGESYENIRSVAEDMVSLREYPDFSSNFINNRYSIDSEGIANLAYIGFSRCRKETQIIALDVSIAVLHSLILKDRIKDPDLLVPDHLQKGIITLDLAGGTIDFKVNSISESTTPQNAYYTFPIANVADWQAIISGNPHRDGYALDGWYIQQIQPELPNCLRDCDEKPQVLEEPVEFVKNPNGPFPVFLVPDTIQNCRDRIWLKAHWRNVENAA